MKLHTYSVHIGYNKQNGVNLYAVSAKCPMFAGIEVFATAKEAGAWIHTLRTEYDLTIERVIGDYYDDLLNCYESAYMLGLRDGRYFILQQEN